MALAAAVVILEKPDLLNVAPLPTLTGLVPLVPPEVSVYLTYSVSATPVVPVGTTSKILNFTPVPLSINSWLIRVDVSAGNCPTASLINS